MDYKNAGVDIEAGYRSVELMKEHVKRTMRPEVLTGLGGFSGAFSMEAYKNMEKPTLVSGTDGVGTKLKLAFLMNKHDTVGIDCVAMCVNDIACAGGEPLFFLDYIACGRNIPERIATIVGGVAEGCSQAGAALIGGETAEMPGFYPVDEYDLAGFAVGIVDQKDLITGADIKAGDVLIGMASSGVHSNGFSLVRKVFTMKEEYMNTYFETLGRTLGEALIEPTKIYVKALQAVKKAGVHIKGCSHITGGGFYENIPRMLPEGMRAVIKKDSYEIPMIFQMLKEDGRIEEQMMYNTFNGGRPGPGRSVRGGCPRGRRDALCARRSTGRRKRSDIMLKVAVLVSGGGTNLQAILDAVETGRIRNAEVVAVISNNPQAYALERAKKHGIPAVCVSRKACGSGETFDDALLKAIKDSGADLVVLAGCLVVIPEKIIQEYRGRIINIHPSLIPSFCGTGYYGLKVHEAALERGVKVTGATVHFVDEGTDTGPILLQKAVEVKEGDTPEILQRRVMEEAEWVLLPKAIDMLANQEEKG